MIQAMLAEGMDWGRQFRPFTLYHLLMTVSCVLAMAGAWVIGKRLKSSAAEAKFRINWGWCVLAYKIVETAWYNWPGNFDIGESLPLQLCDLAAFVAAAAMITQKRVFRTLLYFWGIGLSTQAFFTPILTVGYLAPNFWFFWVSHTMIIGSATYDIIVRGYRPAVKDLLIGFGLTVAYAGVVTAVNLTWDVNYGYIGNTTPENPTIIDKLGSWPLRAFKVAGLVAVLFVILWGVWPLAKKLGLVKGRRPDSGTCPTCGYDLTGVAAGSPCPECGASRQDAIP